MVTGFLMVDQPNPYTAQGTYPRRGVRGKLTGTIILHTSEGNWRNGVESLTNLVRTRGDYGCYHQACDWADIARYYPWEWETWQDSETNNWAVGIAAACKTSDWATMPAEIREGYYRNLGRMAADFVQYMAKTYRIVVPLARISGAQARAGIPGFCAHGDSGIARSDPGADFDWPKFFKYTKAALDGTTPTTAKDWFDMATEPQLRKIIQEELRKDNPWAYKNASIGEKRDAYAILRETAAQVVALKAALTQLAAKQGTAIDYAKIDAIVKESLASAVVDVDINVTGKEATPNG